MEMSCDEEGCSFWRVREDKREEEEESDVWDGWVYVISVRTVVSSPSASSDSREEE